MAKQSQQQPNRAPSRPHPKFSLKESLVIINAIGDNNAGKEMDRLLLADAINKKPTSSDYRDLLSASRAYGLTTGTEKADYVKPTALGISVISPESEEERSNALKSAVLNIESFKKVLTHYNRAKFPDTSFFKNTLTRQFGIANEWVNEFEKVFTENCNYVGFFRKISGTTMVMLNNPEPQKNNQLSNNNGDHEIDSETEESGDDFDANEKEESTISQKSNSSKAVAASLDSLPNKPIFIGHGKNRRPLEKLEKMLGTFKIPFRVTVAEANLGRPISKKVRDTMTECGSAILIFTKDEKFTNSNGEEIWRPSENVVHELGASSFLYEERIVIFKEKGVNLASNYSSMGYIEFETETMEAQSMDLLKELIGFGLVKITPA